MGDQPPYVTLRTRRPADGNSMSSGDSAVRGEVMHSVQRRNRSAPLTSAQYGSSVGDDRTPSATHDISRVSYHVKHLSDFAKSLEDVRTSLPLALSRRRVLTMGEPPQSAARAFPNRGRSQRYKKVQALLLHWRSDDLFVLPELEDLEQCLREDYSFDTDTFAIPSDNSHLELMMRVGSMIKEHESTDTLFIIYYGGHARIDDSRQSTWCAARNPDSPWLQWSAIQTLLERSLSDVLILLDCCAGAASATFPNGNSTTETISASSWDAIAPDPGRYSFTNALIEVLQEWKHRTYSAAMLHAEVLARLKHPRPIMLNGKHFEARSTPVHFMMTSNHKAPSIEMCRIVGDEMRPPSPPQELDVEASTPTGRSGGPQELLPPEPTEDIPHVMISLALEDNQSLDINAWESWLAAFPAIAKYVKVQGIFKSHSTLMLLSLPVMVWDLLPENLATNFIAFIRSNNLAVPKAGVSHSVETEIQMPGSEADSGSIFSGTTMMTGARKQDSVLPRDVVGQIPQETRTAASSRATSSLTGSSLFPSSSSASQGPSRKEWRPSPFGPPGRHSTAPASTLPRTTSSDAITRTMILNQARSSRKTYITSGDNIPDRPRLAPHVEGRLENYFQEDPAPTVAVKEFLASNLGIETTDIDIWFYHRREQQQVALRLQNLSIDSQRRNQTSDGIHMILPGHLNQLLETLLPNQMLIIDLRAPTEYQRSHIHGAINFRVPASFVQRASFDMIEKAIVDDASRDTFRRWAEFKCVVFYDRHIEFAWECPTADALIQRFKAQGWSGHGFIPKGHYREFSASFDKHIGGSRMSANASKYLQSLSERSMEKQVCSIGHPYSYYSQTDISFSQKDNHQDYCDWLRLVRDDDRAASTELVPAVKAERAEAMVQHQKDMEDEFERRLPSLYRKALELGVKTLENQPVDNWERKAPLVEHLSRGLEKMQEAGGGPRPPSSGDARHGLPSYPEKSRDAHFTADDYDVIDADHEHLPSDGAYQPKATSTGVDKAPSYSSGDPAGSTGDTQQKKGTSTGGRGRNLFKMLRSTR
ncbi:rhodanese-like protein [Apiospora marii]|uniref:Rhodanese-like protein n=1 Tax=Apiospora marii TaxID=335849 RepID=A0ABR1S6W5_9PEZI